MAEIAKNDIPHLRHLHGEFQLVLPSHPMMPSGYDFRSGKLLITEWEGILPPPSFSAKRFDDLQRLAEQTKPREFRRLSVLFAKRIIDRVFYDDTLGCWNLPLAAEHDDKGRARYPRFDSSKFGFEYTNAGAHQVSYEVLQGLKIPKELLGSNGNSSMQRMPVDHLCHNHACCNPYHLQVVSHGENSRRGNTVRRSKMQPHLAQKACGVVPYAEALEHFEQFAVRLDRAYDARVEIAELPQEVPLEQLEIF